MCGICGEIRFDSSRPKIDEIEIIVSAMQSRGPDAAGLFAQENVALGHRRLKIIDLSDASQQPLIDSELGLTIVFNGAIYNYPELRKELEEKGYRFFSRGDTEVILKAYHCWGPDALSKFNGMFAFAIWERESKSVFLARDRLGIKPLYYTESPHFFRFASSLPALLKGGGIDTNINPQALQHYMSFHSVVPPPHTILQGIQKLRPGSWLKLSQSGERKEQVYWDLAFDHEDCSFEEWQERVLAALRKAVQRRLIADVPVGVLLSGGLDSSLIVGLLAEEGAKGLQTFSIGFESTTEEKGDEFEYSDVIASHFGTEHHKLQIGARGLLGSLAHCVEAMNEPMVSHDNIGFYLLSEAVSQHVKVVQSGQGADEVFAGYHWYPPLLESTNAVADYAQGFCDRTEEQMAEAVVPRLENSSLEFIRAHFEKPGATEAIDQALRLDTQVMLVDDPVKRVDSMTMAWGLEARVPFLDHELVELAAKVPGKFKVEGGGKYVLKEAARAVIPAKVIDRPKGYFPVPVLKYLRGEYLEFVKDIVREEKIRQRGVIQPAYVKKLLKNPEDYITPLQGSELWQVTLLEYWLQTHID